ncbi:hypothetical protein [Austwickia chelonae]|nr:hypothetical protein [Austwickia chelonae]
MARIPDEVSVARLVEGRGVELRAQSKDLVGRYPFHDDGRCCNSTGCDV